MSHAVVSTLEDAIDLVLSRLNIRMIPGRNGTFEEEIYFSLNSGVDVEDVMTRERFRENLESSLSGCHIKKSIVVEHPDWLSSSVNGIVKRVGLSVRATQSEKIPDSLPANFT